MCCVSGAGFGVLLVSCVFECFGCLFCAVCSLVVGLMFVAAVHRSWCCCCFLWWHLSMAFGLMCLSHWVVRVFCALWVVFVGCSFGEGCVFGLGV